MVVLLIVVWGGEVILDIGILSGDGGLTEEDLTVVHVVVLLRAIVLVGVGVVTKNISLCDRGPILFRKFMEPTDASWLTLSSCGRSFPRAVFKNKTTAIEGPMLPEGLKWVSTAKDSHSGNPAFFFGSRTLPGFPTPCPELSIDTERNLDGSMW